MNSLKIENQISLTFVHVGVNVSSTIMETIGQASLMLEVMKGFLFIILCIVKLIVYITTIPDQLKKVFMLFFISQMMAILALPPFNS